MKPDRYSEHARELRGLPDDWSWYKAEHVTGRNRVLLCTILDGAVAPRLAEGDPSSRRDWARKDRSTEARVVITATEHAEWLNSKGYE